MCSSRTSVTLARAAIVLDELGLGALDGDDRDRALDVLAEFARVTTGTALRPERDECDELRARVQELEEQLLRVSRAGR